MSTCGDGDREIIASVEVESLVIRVQIWKSTMDGVDVVQIDQEDHNGRMRVNLNDAPIWDGDPAKDDHPGAHFQSERGLAPYDVFLASKRVGDISEEVAAHVLNHFGGGGYEPGSFTMSLLEAMVRADPTRFRQLSTLYPEYAAAIVLARNADDGIEILRGVLDGKQG